MTARYLTEKVIYDHDEQTELLEDTIERLRLSDGEDYNHLWLG